MVFVRKILVRIPVFQKCVLHYVVGVLFVPRCAERGGKHPVAELTERILS